MRSAIEKAEEITEGVGIEGHTDALLAIRVNLARTQYILGEREGNAAYLAAAIGLLEDALDGADHLDRASIATGIKELAANALRALGNLEGSLKHLHRAESFLESALEVHRRQAESDLVAITQNNLGLVCLDLANTAKQRGPLERAISLFDSAAGLASQENMTTLWAMTQNNAGQAHEALAVSGSRTDLAELERSRDHYQEAVCGYSRTQTPYYLSSAKTNLGRVLTRLGALGGSIDHLNKAIECLQDAYRLSSKDANWKSVGAICAGLGTAFLTRGNLRANARDGENAVHWLEKAVKTYDPDASPQNWVTVKTNLALSYFQLSKASNEIEPAVHGLTCLEEVLIERDLSTALAVRPEPYIAFLEGIDLVKSMGRHADYVQDLIAKWVPVFTKHEHVGVSRHMLGVVQNDLATVCQGLRSLPAAIELYRRALANLSILDDTNEPASSLGGMSRLDPVASESIDAERLATDVKLNLGTTCRMLGEERACAELLREAIALFEEVLAGLDPAVDPMYWTITQSSKGRACKELYHVEGNVELLRHSLSAYDEAAQNLVEGIDSPWHRQVPGMREEVRRLLELRTDAS